MLEYIKLFWNHQFEDEPVVILYEIDSEKDRMVARAVDIFSDKSCKQIENFYKNVIEICSIPKIEEINSPEYGEEFFACIIQKQEFDQAWNHKKYTGDLFHKDTILEE